MSCIFCKIISKEIPSDVLHETPQWVAIRDVRPQAPHHVLLVPTRHVRGLNDLGPGDGALLGDLLLGAARLAHDLGEAERGYRVVVNTGENGGQSVGHLHIHLLAGRALGWPPG
jgi:histidine triad (HIT) family protein